MQAVGLQTFIWNNNLRSILLLAGFPVLLLFLMFAVQLVLLGLGFERVPASISKAAKARSSSPCTLPSRACRWR